MKKLIKSKATCIHNIPNKILKDSCQVIAPFLTDIFNFSITSNIFPDDLKVGKVSPVHKSGDRDDLNAQGVDLAYIQTGISGVFLGVLNFQNLYFWGNWS